VERREPPKGTSFLEVRRGDPEVVIMSDCALNKAVQFQVAKAFPPAGEGRFIRSGDVGWCVRERGSDGRLRWFVVRADRAAAEENPTAQTQNPKEEPNPKSKWTTAILMFNGFHGVWD